MEIHIDDTRTVNEIQVEFNHKYPYLKLEFFQKPHEVGEGSPEKEKIESDKTLGEIRSKHNEGDVRITPVMPVGDLERFFEEIYGIHLQVFRKSGEVWLETTVTDTWTLEEQNNHAKEREEMLK